MYSRQLRERNDGSSEDWEGHQPINVSPSTIVAFNVKFEQERNSHFFFIDVNHVHVMLRSLSGVWQKQLGNEL
jgi:hypothetical protein